MKRFIVLAAVFMAVAAYSEAQVVTKQMAIK